MAIWRAYTGATPETDRVVASRQLQARTAQASEQLVEKTKGLEATQQESIDQLQVVQDQLQTMKRLMAAQQADTKRLSEQVTTLNESIENLRQSFASARSTDTETPSVTGRKPGRHHASARKRGKSRG
jgi:chromosome segregation ATPase